MQVREVRYGQVQVPESAVAQCITASRPPFNPYLDVLPYMTVGGKGAARSVGGMGAFVTAGAGAGTAGGAASSPMPHPPHPPQALHL